VEQAFSCLGVPFAWLEKPRNRMGRDLDCMADVLMGFHRSQWAHLLPLQPYVVWHCLDSCSAILKRVLLKRP
jgi:hypothetical protein